MIVYTGSYSSAENAAGRPMILPRFLYKNLFKGKTIASATASTELTTGPRDALLRPETQEWWTPTAMPATWEGDLGANVSVSAIGLASHDFGTKSTTVLIETQLDGGSWTTFASSHAPTADEPILFLDSPRTIDRVRMTLTGSSISKVAVLFAGPTLTMERPLQIGYKPITKNRKSVRQTLASRGGHYLGQEFMRRGLQASISFRFLTESWYYTNFDDFAKTSQNYPYFFAPRPDVFLNDVVYAWHDRDIDPSYHGHIYIGVGWEMTAIQND